MVDLDAEYAFRDEMVRRLEADLIGPAGDVNELIDEEPLDRYIVGVLWPVTEEPQSDTAERTGVGRSRCRRPARRHSDRAIPHAVPEFDRHHVQHRHERYVFGKCQLPGSSGMSRRTGSPPSTRPRSNSTVVLAAGVDRGPGDVTRFATRTLSLGSSNPGREQRPWRKVLSCTSSFARPIRTGS